MGRGVQLNANTHHKMRYNGAVEWVVDQDTRSWRFRAEGDTMTVQLVEDGSPVQYDRLKVIDNPWKTLNEYAGTHKRLPEIPKQEDFTRAWKKQVKRAFNRNGWERK